MDRSANVALSIASVSVISVLAITRDFKIAVAQLFLVGFPLALIMFPDGIEYGYGYSRRGQSHGGEPTPGVILKILGWISLIAFAVGGPVFKFVQPA